MSSQHQLIGMQFDTVSKKMKETMIAGQLTRENGEFSLEKLPVRGEFTLKINYLSYASYEQKVSLIPRGFEIRDMAEVQQVKAAVGGDESATALAHGFTPLREVVPGDDLVAKIHGGILADAISAWQRF